MRYFVLSVLTLVLIVGVGIVGFFYLRNSCSLEPTFQQSSSVSNNERADKQAEKPDSGERLPNKKIEHAGPGSFQLRVTEPNKIEGSYYAAEKQGDESDWGHKFVCEMKFDGLLVALFTLFLVLVTGLLTISTDLLRRASNRAEETSAAGQRAYISLLAPHADFVRDNNGLIVGIRVWGVWKNSGTTPATNVFAFVGATFTSNPDDFVFGQADNNMVETPLAVGPGVEIQSGEITISPQHFLAALEGNGAQFFWGRARYRDIFPGTREHIVEFCYRVLIEGTLAPPPPNIRLGFTPVGQHNRYYDA